MKIIRENLFIHTCDKLYESRGSSNVPITLENDDSFSDYTVELHFGIFRENKQTDGIAMFENGKYLIPSMAFESFGPLYIAVHLIKGDEIRVTNQITFIVKNAPNGTQIMPSELDWQSIVDNYVRQELYLYAFKSSVDDVQRNVDGVNERVSQIIAQSGTSDTEVVASRVNTKTGDSYTTLGDRLDSEFEKQMKKHLLEYDGANILENGNALTFTELYNMLMTKPDFAVLVYNNFAYHPNGVSTEQIVFSSSYPVSGLDVNHRITMLKNGNITKTDATDENVINKTNAITDANKDSEVKYPSVKATSDYVGVRVNEVSTTTDEKITSLKNNEIASIQEVNRKQDFEIENLLAMSKGQLYREETDSSVSRTKSVPTGALPNATLDMLGGMSRKGKNVLKNVMTNGTTGGISYIVNGDKSITVSGVRTSAAPRRVGVVFLNEGDTVTYGVAKGSFDNMVTYVISPSGITNTATFPYTFVVNETGNWEFYLKGSENDAEVSGTGYVQVEKGNVATDYEPYTDQLIDAKVDELMFWKQDASLLTSKQRLWLYNNQDIWLKDDVVIIRWRETNNMYVLLGVFQVVDNIYINCVNRYKVSPSGVYEIQQVGAWGLDQSTNNHILYSGKFEVYGEKHDSKITIGIPNDKNYPKQVPQAVQNLDGYGIGINDTLYNYFERKDGRVLFHKRLGSVDLGTLNYSKEGTIIEGENSYNFYAPLNDSKGYFSTYGNTQICAKYIDREASPLGGQKNKCCGFGNASKNINIWDLDFGSYTTEQVKEALDGVMLYYELEQEEIIDISDLLPKDFDILQVEENGTVEFHYPSLDDGYEIDMPNTESYLINLQGE